MVLSDHVCPFGVRAKALLEAHQIAFDDNILSSHEEVDACEAKHGVDTTPQIFIAGERIGSCDAWRQYLADH